MVFVSIWYISNLLQMFVILFYRLKEFFQTPNFQPFKLKANDVFQYGSDDESCHSDHGMIASLPHTEERPKNSTFTPQPLSPDISPSSSQLEQSVCPPESDESIAPRSPQRPPLPAVLTKKCPSSIQEKVTSCIGTDQQLINYVKVFQQISTDSLVSRMSPLIPILEKIKDGKVSKLNIS